MKGFIVWDEVDKKFLKLDDLNVLNYVYDNELETLIETIEDSGKVFIEDIGIKDINNKPIYADCSVLEFEWEDSLNQIRKEWGVIKFNLEYMQYFIYEENNIINIWDIRRDNIKNIEIIGTIQENKLVLIKDES